MRLHSKIKDYTVEMSDHTLKNGKKIFSDLKYNNLFYFVDANLYKIYAKQLNKFIGKDFFLLISPRETNKSYLRLANYYRPLIKAGFKRGDMLVTFGGGILQDISGFIASTLYRGIKWAFIPSTLLAQADSCIGSKTSINFDDAKNLIGTFYPPDSIYIDTGFCLTLPKEHFNSGIGEIIKFHLMSNVKDVDFLKRYLTSADLRTSHRLRPIVFNTLKIKKSYFQNDEFDSGRRNLLNYGHCFGHALESASNFSISHGEAVIIGMGFANLLALKRGIMSKATYAEFEQLLSRFYPDFNLSAIKTDKLIYFLERDKKRTGKHLTMILCKDIGKQYKFDDILKSEINNTYKDFLKEFKK